MVLSFTFRELGPHLHRDSAWVTPLVVRTAMVNNVKGGWSAMLRAYLNLHLFSEGGLGTAGAVVRFGGQQRLLFAKVENVLADGDGLRLALQWSGQGGG